MHAHILMICKLYHFTWSNLLLSSYVLKGVLYNVPVIVELVGSVVANQILHIDEKDMEGKVKFVLQSIFT